MAAKEEEAAKDSAEKEAGLSVRSKTAGFRRAGRAWPAEETIVRAADFTEAQIEALHDEPELFVSEVEIDVESEA